MSITSGLLIIVIAFLAGIEGILDEFQLHQPLVACTLIGWACNQLETGVILGGTLQMIALGWANIGASVAPDVTLASVASAILLMLSGMQTEAIYLAIAVAIPLSMLGLKLTGIVRQASVKLVHHMDDAAKEGNIRAVEKWHLVGVCLQGLRVAIPAALLLLLPASAVHDVVAQIPVWIMEGLCIGGGLVVAVGYAIVINVMAVKDIWPFFILGFVLAMLSELSLLALAMIGAVFAVIYLLLCHKKNNGTPDSGDPLDDILNDY